MVDPASEIEQEREEESLLPSLNGSTSSTHPLERSRKAKTLDNAPFGFLGRGPKTTFLLAVSVLANFAFVAYFILLVPPATGLSKSYNNSAAWDAHPPVVYGLVHMAKAAGTEINGQLASRYDNVCGNKGYSYDAYQFNKRQRLNGPPNKTHNARDRTGDMYDKLSKGTDNRGHVPPKYMKEIGFEDCDYISLEDSAQEWLKIAALFPKSGLELHVPCRDPVDHLMSMCFHRNLTFQCSPVENLEDEVAKCAHWLHRFTPDMKRYPHVKTIKCFQAIPTRPYIDYMGNFLIHKRLPADYVHRESGPQNVFHNRSNDCVYHDANILERVRYVLLRDYDYFHWCDKCLGSENELDLS